MAAIKFTSTKCSPSLPVIERSERELHEVLNGKVRWDHLPLNERRDLLEPVISPTFAALCQPNVAAEQARSSVEI